MPRFTKDFDTFEECTLWLHERGLSGALRSVLPDDDDTIEEMFPGGVRLTLEGEDAKRAQDIEHPIDPDGFRLVEVA